ncbi:hypothetical protein [Hymenobacter negativus]|uniref:Uncharacterized protein n=1 Tax=Hymenobacter negativus TaxID=2795026 RepID=A0ABS0Q3N8_9BACT|nr:hypothetical protein [Hymenobacter negativus]MBH8556914.1 hypothetical protein [Hymenobacter negativus]
MSFRAGSARIWIHEIAWLLGSWAFSWLLLSLLMGFNYLWQPKLDIQMHNTYFVLPPLLLTTLVWLPVATVVTGVRVLTSAFRNSGPNSVLVILVGIWTLFTLLIALRGVIS